jgi:hypothetical protein
MNRRGFLSSMIAGAVMASTRFLPMPSAFRVKAPQAVELGAFRTFSAPAFGPAVPLAVARGVPMLESPQQLIAEWRGEP